MARTLEQERTALEEDERRLEERRRAFAERERQSALAALEKSGLLKLGMIRLEALAATIRKLGPDEVEKRLQAKA